MFVVAAGSVVTVGLLGVAALGLWTAAQPESVTGDRATDAACWATAEAFGVKDFSDFWLLSEDEQRATFVEIAGHADGSSDPAIQQAANGMAVARSMGVVATSVAVLEMAKACQAAGWDARKAGLVPG